MNAIELQNLSKTFRQGWRGTEVSALKGVSLAVEQGEAFGFVGQNGAGKSTTIKILTGALRHDGGEARLFGFDVADFRSRVGLGYVPENPWLYDYLTPLEIVRMGVIAHGRRKGADVSSHCRQWLERLGLGPVAQRRVRGFSKGMLQRTALAHALACEPRLLILDEPLSGLDPLGRREVVDILLEYRKGGGTVFFSSHVLHDVERLADRFGLIHKGELRSVQQPSEVCARSETVLVRSIGAQPVEGLSPEVGGRWSGDIPATDVWHVLDRLREAGHTLLEVRPGMSLERLFLDVVRRDQ
ncbi:ABC transporter ATP-binding protein [Thauera sp. 2A1]|uniref:ABC transporter ATP-binding protein n=1 Tax=Thauera sp. 2A1 TaxID=2570191 RepID=UPI0012926B7A|nr:ABC transporter ATP-binding protein [Thauera sp. 2A1]KAI5916295.1 ABC transporter ATP-binding protein [Thauera sp. 2A1]